MSLVDWLKGLTERPSADGAAKTPRARAAHKGGESYAQEWVKVLEENAPDHDPFNTYSWELKPDAQGTLRPQPVKKPDASPFDTYTWELQEGDSPDDPWGLKKDPAAEKPAKKDGINPYDTGVFDASWTGRFDER